MRIWLLAVFLGMAFAGDAAAQAGTATQTTAALIDSLTDIDGAVVGVDGFQIYDGFIADARTLEFTSGVLGAPPPNLSPPMRELVRRGVAVLPELIAHLDDARPTKLVVGKDGKDFFYMFKYFGAEYDPRVRRAPYRSVCGGCVHKSFDDPYTVRVADICYVLIGQIVGRNLTAVRYQPTAGLVVNSPLEAPDIVTQLKQDWHGLTRTGFRAFLLDDVEHAPDLFRAAPALQRLRFYFPTAYAALRGDGLGWRDKFEAHEKQRAAEH